jgi:hypothetical protein
MEDVLLADADDARISRRAFSTESLAWAALTMMVDQIRDGWSQAEPWTKPWDPARCGFCEQPHDLRKPARCISRAGLLQRDRVAFARRATGHEFHDIFELQARRRAGQQLTERLFCHLGRDFEPEFLSRTALLFTANVSFIRLCKISRTGS